jgi:TonB family protein
MYSNGQKRAFAPVSQFTAELMKPASFFLIFWALALIGCASQRPAIKPRVNEASSCAPRYPAEARRNDIQGKVVVRVMVEPSGTVSKVELGETSGFPALDRAAMEAAKCQHFEPGSVGGVPSAMWTEFPVNFILAAKAQGHGLVREDAPTYAEKIAASVRRHVVLPEAAQLPGNPRAEFTVSLRPDGWITHVELTKSSGDVVWDEAARSALVKTEVIPFDVDGKVPRRISIGLRPRP